MDTKKINQVLTNIQNVFIHEDQYELRKSIEEFQDSDKKFLGDFVSFLMVDKNTNPPTFYLVASPFDLISKKDPQHALVWQGGKLLLNTDYTDYAAMRTGAMDSIALKASGIEKLSLKKVLLFGTGRTARWSLRILKTAFKDLKEIDYINSTNTKSEEFESFSNELGVIAKVGEKEKLVEYDIIICHTNAKAPILSKDDIKRIKKTAIITTFIGSTEHGEVADEFYNGNANIVLDWDKNFKIAKDLVRSKISEKNIIYLKDLLTKSKSLSSEKKYTIFRFVGTPMQNLGVLQALISE
jgi:ornithine cyclodeaminase/alanine dehydrogenase-like protein (mu-crystallin family)